MKVTTLSLLAITITFSGFFKATQHETAPELTNDNRIWKTDLDMGGGFVLTTFLTAEKEGNQVTISSPRNADIRVVGWAKSYMGRLFRKLPKKGSLIKIQGVISGDSISGDAFIAVLGKMQFKGSFYEDSISGSLVKNDTVKVATISGKLTEETSISYTQLYSKVADITEKHIYSKHILTNDAWVAFQDNFKSLCSKAQDDLELFIGFSMYTSELPFSHFHLLMNAPQESDAQSEEKSILFKEKTHSVAYLKIDNFSTSTEELELTMPKILEGNYAHFIVDLRDNSGGGVEAAYAFAKHIINTKTDIGYFTTNRFEFDAFDPATFSQLPEVEPTTTEGFINYLMQNTGAKMIIGAHQNKVFTGQLYILTNANTASTCEPIVYALKGRNNVTVLGETTAGAMLSANYFDLYGKYKLILPIADFYTMDGLRLDGVGVSPDISTESDSALIKAYQLIREN